MAHDSDANVASLLAVCLMPGGAAKRSFALPFVGAALIRFGPFYRLAKR